MSTFLIRMNYFLVCQHFWRCKGTGWTRLDRSWGEVLDRSFFMETRFALPVGCATAKYCWMNLSAMRFIRFSQPAVCHRWSGCARMNITFYLFISLFLCFSRIGHYIAFFKCQNGLLNDIPKLCWHQWFAFQLLFCNGFITLQRLSKSGNDLTSKDLA